MNTCLNYQRDHKVDRLVAIHGDYSLFDNVPAAENVEDMVLSRSYGETVQMGIRSLNENYRIALALRYTEGLSYEQIAQVLNQPLGTVKSTISRGRNQLRAYLVKNNVLEG